MALPYGVGNSTTIENIEIIGNLDDGLEILEVHRKC